MLSQQKNYGPISVIITEKTTNPKTGDMAQVWIIRNDMLPTEACKSGHDSAICGDCKHRPINGNTCYVCTWQAPQAIYKAMKRGNYQDKEIAINKNVRLGAYGDPSFIPLDDLQDIVLHAINHTGYTHQWKNIDTAYSNYLMASVDNIDEYNEAQKLGYRTFRVRKSGDPLLPNEINCLADSAGMQCNDCLGCGGNMSKIKKDISIVIHGSRKNNFKN